MVGPSSWSLSTDSQPEQKENSQHQSGLFQTLVLHGQFQRVFPWAVPGSISMTHSRHYSYGLFQTFPWQGVSSTCFLTHGSSRRAYQPCNSAHPLHKVRWQTALIEQPPHILPTTLLLHTGAIQTLNYSTKQLPPTHCQPQYVGFCCCPPPENTSWNSSPLVSTAWNIFKRLPAHTAVNRTATKAMPTQPVVCLHQLQNATISLRRLVSWQDGRSTNLIKPAANRVAAAIAKHGGTVISTAAVLEVNIARLITHQLASGSISDNTRNSKWQHTFAAGLLFFFQVYVLLDRW